MAACGPRGSESTGSGRDADADVVAEQDRLQLPADSELTFTEVSAAVGLVGTHTDLDIAGDDAMTSGAAVADVDGDGHLDIFLTRVGKPNALYINDGTGNFTDVAADAGVAGPSERFGSSAATFADFDGDGHLDLFVTGYGQGAHELFMANGDGTFREESSVRGLVWPELSEGESAHAYGAAVTDVDGDGHMDLLVLHWDTEVINDEAREVVRDAASDAAPDPSDGDRSRPCGATQLVREAGFPRPPDISESRSRLFLNDGTGRFADATEDMDLPLSEIVAFTANAVDLDGDGWVDLGIVGDACTSRLFRNVGGTRFEDITRDAGVGTDENGMGAVMRDITGNGHPDWFITSIAQSTDNCKADAYFFGCSGNRLYENRGDGTFSDVTDDYGVRDGGWGWGAVAEDFDNDGRIEISMNNGYRSAAAAQGADSASSPAQPGSAGGRDWEAFATDSTRFWELDSDSGTYRDVARSIGIDDSTIGHALIAFDMNGNGKLDLLSVPTGGPPRLWRNDTPTDNTWISISLDDPLHPGNRWGDGARVEVTPRPGDEPIVGWITTTGSYESQSPPRFHVGLGSHTGPLHRVEVHWPHPRRHTQTLTDVPVDQALRVTRDS